MVNKMDKNVDKTADILSVIESNCRLKSINVSSEIRGFKWFNHEKYVMFIDLISKYNSKIKEYQPLLEEYKNIYEYLKTMETTENSDETGSAEKFLISEIQKEINSFRKLKAKLVKEVDDASVKLSKCSWINLKTKLKARVAMSKATRTLNNFKLARKEIKGKAKKQGIIISSTFLHSVLNYKDKSKKSSYTGILGYILYVKEFIDTYTNSNNQKKLKIDDIAYTMRRLNLINEHKKTFLYGQSLIKKLDDSKIAKVDIATMKGKIAELKKSIDKSFYETLKKISKCKTKYGITSCIYELQDNFDEQKKTWVLNLNEVFSGSEKLETFIDIHFEVKSLAIFKEGECVSLLLSLISTIAGGAITGSTVSIAVLTGAELLSAINVVLIVVIPFQLFAIIFGLSLLLIGIVTIYDGLKTSNFKENQRRILEAQEEASKTQNGTSKDTKNQKNEEKISQEKDKKIIKNEPEKKKSSGMRRFINHFKKDKKIKEDGKEPQKSGKVHQLVERFEKNKKIIRNGVD